MTFSFRELDEQRSVLEERSMKSRPKAISLAVPFFQVIMTRRDADPTPSPRVGAVQRPLTQGKEAPRLKSMK